jgi:hypothetical protein
MASAPREICTIHEFRRFAARDPGFIVITDSAYPAHVHRSDCPWLRERYFEAKVIRNQSRNGNYYWVPSVGAARSQLGAVRCEKCLAK